ncbi:MAG: M48 family metalloprotease [Terracidiphilus sp.]|jgi:predicted Zn-dependent protease
MSEPGRPLLRLASILLCALVCFISSPRGRTQQALASDFQFTKVDDDLLSEANATDALYEKQGLVLHDPALQAYIDAVGKRVLGGRPVPQKVQFQFRVLRDTMVNAFALPNGTVYITTGILALLENEAQLAGVLGHETAHVYERHSYLENRSIRKKALTINILAIAGSWAPIGTGAAGAFGAAIFAGAEVSSIVLVATVYGYSREMEWQADRDGLAAMTAAGYDPHAMADAFALLDQDRTLEFEPYSTFYHDHPKLVARKQKAEDFANANTPAGAFTGSEKDYLAAVAPAIAYNIANDIENRRARTAVARAARLTAAFHDEPRYQVLLADGYRALGARTPAPSQQDLTPDGEDLQRKEYFKMTEQEEQKKLLTKPEGREALKANQAQSEKLLLAVIQNHPNYAPAYRDLGFVYQDEARYSDAAAQYRRYLDLVASTSLDHLRIEHRLAEVGKLQTAQAH